MRKAIPTDTLLPIPGKSGVVTWRPSTSAPRQRCGHPPAEVIDNSNYQAWLTPVDQRACPDWGDVVR